MADAGGLARLADLPPRGSSVHLLGAAGAGMRALGQVLVHEGWSVSGSDRDSRAAAELADLGIRVVPEADTSPVRASRLVVHSSALPPGHPALRAAAAAGVPVWKRARALGALVNDRRLVGVAGTHGKTTVTAMLAVVLEAAGRDPLALVGGEVPEWGSHARPGRGEAVVEADEYDRSFLELDPALAVVTSLEAEHLECYDGEDGLREAFVRFANRAVSRDGVLLCADDPGARALAARIGPARLYGFAEDAEYRVEAQPAAAGRMRGVLVTPEGRVELELEVPGRHNLQNAAAAAAAALRLGVVPRDAARALARFRGVRRRLQVLHRGGGLTIVDDYAHHPTEVRASIAALRTAHPGARLVVAFQPHLYSRTAALAPEFGRALAGADLALVLPVYGAREAPLPGVDAALVAREAPPHVREGNAGEALATARDAGGELVLAFMGAGDVTEVARLAAREAGGDALGA
ncbi:MAG: UDP-N-acetylmuramate--L-alanine ligase [Gemmatimonadota bacterium]|nr:UDP-N-acetylmuramate--L-alanine ligase [Gemmatimonadota bacterium]